MPPNLKACENLNPAFKVEKNHYNKCYFNLSWWKYLIECACKGPFQILNQMKTIKPDLNGVICCSKIANLKAELKITHLICLIETAICTNKTDSELCTRIDRTAQSMLSCWQSCARLALILMDLYKASSLIYRAVGKRVKARFTIVNVS
jgi:hypothetical protein